MRQRLTLEDKKTFDRDGYLLIPGFFSNEEINRLSDISKDDALIDKNMYDRGDKEGLKTKLSLWFFLDDSVYSLMTC